MGVVAAIVSWVFFAVLFVGGVAANPAAARAEIEQNNQRMAALNFDPEAARMTQEMFAGTRGLVLYATMKVVMSLGFLMIFSSVAGVLAAGGAKDRDR